MGMENDSCCSEIGSGFGELDSTPPNNNSQECPQVIYYTAVFGVVMQCSLPQMAAENRTKFLHVHLISPLPRPPGYKK